jgi:putative ABC transport system permease protein
MASYRSAAERVFRRLLRLYPGEFRAAWEQEMTLLVRDRSREEPLPSLLLAMLVDTVKTAPREHYAMWSQDVRYALRRMARNPAFTLVAALSLALGTGAAASIFSMADALVLRPLPIAEPGEVMTLRPKTDSSPWGADFYSISWPDYLDYREKSRSFTGLVALTDTSLSIATDAKAQAQLRFGMLVSGNFFGVMGVEPVLGRGFLPEEDTVPGRDAVAVVSHSLWTTAFGSDPAAVGKRIRLNGTEFTVVGVAPERFTGMDLFVRPAVFLPMNALPLVSGEAGHERLRNRGERFLSVKGRLRPEADAKAAEAELNTIARGLAEAYPATNRESRGVLVRGELQARIDASPPDAYLSGLLLALTGLVLLIACANVANLLLSQAGARERELALRQAVGASRTRLVRQLLTEGLVLAFLGGMLGLLVAWAGVQFFKRIPMPTELITFGVQLDRRVLLFGFLASSLSVLAFGLVPALRTARADLVTAFKAGDSLQGSKRLWGRKGLVVGQVALALVLLGATATLLRGFSRLLGGEPGYRRDHLLMASFDPSVLRYTDEQAQRFYRELVERARSLPGARSAALAAAVPTGNGQQGFRYEVEGQTRPKDKDAPSTFGISVDEHYFDTFRVPIVKGRSFAVTDTRDAPLVVIVNEHLAEKLWPGRDPLGRRLRLDAQDDDAPWAEVVGVARQHRYIWVGEAPSDYLYVPFAQSRRQRMTLLLESVGDPASLVVPLRELVATIDPDLPLYNVRTMEDFYAKRIQGVPAMIVQTVGSLGVMGGVLALVGLYGLVAYSVSRRTREIGVRMAVGASRRQVLLMVLGQGLLLASVGIAIGVLGSLGVSRLFTAIIEGIPPVEAATLLAVPLMLLAASALATVVPALRASRVDPLRVLRSE